MELSGQLVEQWLTANGANPGTIFTLGLFSFLLGLTHTLGPGHGKSLLLGVLVAENRRLGHALKMAAVIGLTHMADVIALSLVSIVIVASFSFQSISSIVGWVSGLALLAIGLYRLWDLREGGGNSEHDHHHEAPTEKGKKSHQHETENLWTAFFYSLAPCPGAWVLFTACLGLGKPVYGLYLLLGFTLGLLTMISLIALSIVYSTQWLEDYVPGWVGDYAPVFSGVIIIVLGLWILATTALFPGHIH